MTREDKRVGQRNSAPTLLDTGVQSHSLTRPVSSPIYQEEKKTLYSLSSQGT